MNQFEPKSKFRLMCEGGLINTWCRLFNGDLFLYLLINLGS